MQREIVLPEAKPAYEWIAGKAVQKMSPKRVHARLQGRAFSALDEWAADTGETGTEWRFRITPAGEATTIVVPDVAYIANDRLRGLTDDELDEPPTAPNVAIEIRSPGDRQSRVDEKTRVYLAGGSDLVIVIDPQTRNAIAYDDTATATFEATDVLKHPKMPGFALDLGALFAVIDR